MSTQDWLIYQAKGDDPAAKYEKMLGDSSQCPPWRDFTRFYKDEESQQEAIKRSGSIPEDQDKRGDYFVPSPEMIEMVNAALYLRRPLLVVGKPGVGKSTLIYSVARQLKMGPVLRWGVNSRSTRQDGLYHYDAIGRLQAMQMDSGRSLVTDETQPGGSQSPPGRVEIDIGDYLTLGPVGTAMLPWSHPRALLIDEIDKGDPDLANDLLDLLEEGRFRIPELARLKKSKSEIEVMTADLGQHQAKIIDGEVQCLHFPFVVLTSNGERDFPPAFRRRCLHLEVTEPPDFESLRLIVEAHLPEVQKMEIEWIIKEFIELRAKGLRTNDQLLQAVFLLTRDLTVGGESSRDKLVERLISSLN